MTRSVRQDCVKIVDADGMRQHTESMIDSLSLLLVLAVPVTVLLVVGHLNRRDARLWSDRTYSSDIRSGAMSANTSPGPGLSGLDFPPR